MSDERTEEAGLAGLLHLTVGGKPVDLRVLTIEESDEWQRALGAKIGDLDVPESGDGGEWLGNALVAGAAAKLDVVLAYDVNGRLGSRESVRKHMTKAELASALEAILDAENPKEEAANRSVVEAFGRPNLMVRAGLGAVQRVASSLLANTTNGRSPSGDLNHMLSALASPENSSSSSGPTASGASNGRQKKPASSPRSPRRTATSTPPSKVMSRSVSASG